MSHLHWWQTVGSILGRAMRIRVRELLLVVGLVAMSAAWWTDHRRLNDELAWKHEIGKAWSTEQATGPPDTEGAGDLRTAWASATPDAQQEWLELTYPVSVVPIAVVIHETYNPGAVIRVTSVNGTGFEQTLWEGRDPTPASNERGISRLPVKSVGGIARIKVYIDSPAVPGWNEIDAVGLVRKDGTIVWADRAWASSSYATRYGYVMDVF